MSGLVRPLFFGSRQLSTNPLARTAHPVTMSNKSYQRDTKAVMGRAFFITVNMEDGKNARVIARCLLMINNGFMEMTNQKGMGHFHRVL